MLFYNDRERTAFLNSNSRILKKVISPSSLALRFNDMLPRFTVLSMTEKNNINIAVLIQKSQD